MLSICSGKYMPEYESGFNMHSLKLPFVSKKAISSEKDKKLPNFICKWLGWLLTFLISDNHLKFGAACLNHLFQ